MKEAGTRKNFLKVWSLKLPEGENRGCSLLDAKAMGERQKYHGHGWKALCVRSLRLGEVVQAEGAGPMVLM